MSYTPTTWASGDVITAEKLNKLENGVANNSNDYLYVTLTRTESGGELVYTADKTAAEIYAAAPSVIFNVDTYSDDWSSDIFTDINTRLNAWIHDSDGYRFGPGYPCNHLSLGAINGSDYPQGSPRSRPI